MGKILIFSLLEGKRNEVGIPSIVLNKEEVQQMLPLLLVTTELAPY